MNNAGLFKCAALCCVVVAGASAAWGEDVPCRTGAVLGEARRIPGSHDKVMAVCIEGNRLYAGEGSDVVVYDISSPLNPKRLGATKDAVGSPRQIAAQDGMLYVTARENALWIIDATNPSAPKVRSRFDTCELATGVDVAGDVCFVGQRQNGVEFIDVSNPDDPRHIAMRKTDESQSVKYLNGILYSGDWGSGELTVFDARDMKDIRQIGLFPLWGFGDGVWTKGKYLYAATGHHLKNRNVADHPASASIAAAGKKPGEGCGHGLDIFDISDPANPKRVGRADYPPFYQRGLDMWMPRTSANSDMVFCSATHNGLFAVDCTDKTAPKVADRWVSPLDKHDEWPSACVGSVAVGDGCVYAATMGNGLFVIPAKGAAKETVKRGVPPKNASFREPYPTDENEFYVWKPEQVGQARGVAVIGSTIYAACGDAGLHVLKLDAKGGMRKIGELKGHAHVYDVVADGRRLYTAEGPDGFGFYEMDAPTKFREIGRLDSLGKGRKSFGFWVWAPAPGFLGLSARTGGNVIFDISDIANPKRQVMVAGSPGWDKYLMDKAIGGGRFLAHNGVHDNIYWIDLQTSPASVFGKTKKNGISLADGICRFSDDKALVTKGDSYYFAKPGELDPEDGSLWAFKKFPPVPDGKKVQGIPRASGDGLVVLTDRIRRRVALYDFKDQENPKLLKFWSVSGNPDTAVFYEGKVVIPCGYQGVLMQK